jgi:hypothetical protein
LEVALNEASKIDVILDAWLEYVALDDYSNARVEASSNKVQLRGINLVSDNLLQQFEIAKRSVGIKPTTKINRRMNSGTGFHYFYLWHG